MRTLRAVGYATFRALSGMRRSPGATAWVVGAIAMAFVLLGLVHLTARNVDGLTHRLGGAQMIVYLDHGVSPEHADKISAALSQLPAVEQQAYVGQEQALERVRASLDDDDLIAGLELGMLPASIEVSLTHGVRDVAAISPIVNRLQTTPGVESVEVTGEWIDRLAALRAGLQRAGWALFALVMGTCIFFVAASIALQMRSRRGEARVFDLMGASRMFVRGPLLINGIAQGAAGAALAALALWLIFQLGSDAVSHLLAQVLDRTETVAFLPPSHVALLIAGGGLFGLVGALLGIRRYEKA